VSVGRGKRRTVAALLVVFAVWPLAHYFVVAHYGLDPWKFAGWAMYTQPSFLPTVEVFELREGARVKTPLIGSRLEPAAAEQRRLREAALRWGRLVDTDELAALARAGLGTNEPLEIVITRFRIDRRSARLTATRTSYLYQPGRGSPTTW
jgi:hypothetical protein